ncbi:MAG TPA: PAS domain-containing protein [Aliidongia sp.]|uniref:PAS domain-containing protein n=1 Tax=Aliidongia sp. TaxID=1914230 RepID=UPI002DDCF57D|nr:PAS domain-containing protein [Aliidongia sp.]HEV2674447.1 PAS domain-containing protein [Aliidongia sp.]
MIDRESFREKIRSPILRKLLDYWDDVRGERLMPNWSDIKPEEIAAVLPHIWAWHITAADEARLRLVGESIYQAMSRDLRGARPTDLYPSPTGAEIQQRLLKVARLPTCSYTVGDVFHGPLQIGTGDRLALPYADGRGGLGVIGASKLEPAKDPNTGKPMEINPKAFFVLAGEEFLLRLAPA